MTAYGNTNLYNKYVQEQASAAFRNKCIDENAYRNILEKHAHTLYTPNYFIRIGLALLTIMALTFSLVLLWLITRASSDDAIIGLLIFFAVLCYGLLELMVKQKKYYNAGIDNILMTAIVLLIISAFLVNDFDNNYEVISCTTMLVCLWLAIRFNDAFMAILAYAATITFFFLLYIKLGSVSKLTAPFVLMVFAVLIYLYIQQLLSIHKLVIYKYCMQWVTLLTLITFYAAGNYFAVDRLSMEMFGTSIVMGWLFWIFTLGAPPAYIFYGLKQKENMFYRTGFVLMVAGILTVRYYHTVLSAEVAMIIFGILLIAISYTLIKYLSTPKKGFTFEDDGYRNKNLLNAEALIIAQVVGKKATVEQDGVQFGGGSSGGAGASGEY
ncbi:hypothetical protein FRZ67_14620 [Panacibacter ginsenosidivorans]|uniref:DUF2157 domain-containing protein n=1 Tax=Panacibacter ginsenosidivorans TaxID=1813871 RepID=A0A5B8VB43_9BACT|nr:hypothetical protein [Panacibacter ginsenosidivorans]QEC68479.1 hypothetical protein FRZ67_14620 [Panacibacter ginsenosidivorans]